mgnify:CR=1 FL=1
MLGFGLLVAAIWQTLLPMRVAFGFVAFPIAMAATLLPLGTEAWPVSVGYDLDEAIAASPDVVMMLRIQAERMHAAFFPNAREYSRQWGLNDERAALLREASIVMHPGPMNRGLEISSGAADSHRSTVLEQVTNGVSLRMAVLYLLLSGATEPRGPQNGTAIPAPAGPKQTGTEK